ncbi:nucleoside deaminase [Streptomyces sp. HSW2009]|uniref:nucleoside deaminase n=1 Tax=Streptomyces sp. HSW2009 TaxID=3142890 RepID=UPI0032F04D91
MAKHEEFMTEAVRLAKESVNNNWGGPFGAVIVRGGRIVARGQNRVLLTGDPTAHGEVEAIRKAVQVLNPSAPSIARDRQHTSTLKLIPREPNSPDKVGARARMLKGCVIYTSGAPCPMCMSAIYWARISAVYFACDLKETERIGFSDAYQYKDFTKPLDQRLIPIKQIFPGLGKMAYRAWKYKTDQHPY